MASNIKNKSLFKGVWFQFEIENGTKVSVNCLPNGKELVYVGDALVSEKYTLLRGIHNFNVFNKSYTINTGQGSNLLMGDITCSMFQDGVHIDSQEKAYFKNKSNVLVVLAFAVLALVFGNEIGQQIGKLLIWMKS